MRESATVVGTMTFRRRLLLTSWLVIQLLLGQQLALAHMIGHLGEEHRAPVAALDVFAHGEDADHGAAHALSHVCATCLDCLGLDVTLCRKPCAGTLPDLVAIRVATAPLHAPPLRRLVLSLIRAPPSLPG